MKNNCRIQYKSDGIKEIIIFDALVRNDWKEYTLENNTLNKDLFENFKKLAEFINNK